MFSRKATAQVHGYSPLIIEAVKQCRMALDMSQRDLARQIHKNTEYVKKLESGAIPVEREVILDCAAAFGLSLSELVEIAASESTLLVLEEEEEEPVYFARQAFSTNRRPRVC